MAQQQGCEGSAVKILDPKEQSMKLSGRRKIAFVLLPAIALVSCSQKSENIPVKPMSRAIAVGKCDGYTWQKNCSANSPNLCPQPNVGGDCKMSISDDGNAAAATQQGQPASDYICV